MLRGTVRYGRILTTATMCIAIFLYQKVSLIVQFWLKRRVCAFLLIRVARQLNGLAAFMLMSFSIQFAGLELSVHKRMFIEIEPEARS